MTGGSRRFVLKTTAFFVIWLFVSGQVGLYYVVLGLLCSAAVALVDMRRSAAPRHVFPWVRFLAYLPWLTWRVILSALHVTRLILSPSLPIDPQLIRYSTRLRDHAALTLLGNSITMTPGTVTVEITPRELVVHAIDGPSSTDLTSQSLENHVARVFALRERNHE